MHAQRLMALALLILLASPMQAEDERRVVTVTYGHFPPWISKELPDGGYLRSLITKAFKHSGYDVAWEFLPWKRALKKVREGDADASAAWASHPERNRAFRLSIPVYRETNLLFRRHGTAAIVWDALCMEPHKVRVAIPLGYTRPPLLEQMNDNGCIDLIKVRTASSSLKMLARGRVEYAYSGLYSGLYARNRIWSEDSSPILPGELILTANQGHVLFNPHNADSEEKVAALNKGLQHLFHNGEALALREKLLIPMVSGLSADPADPADPGLPSIPSESLKELPSAMLLSFTQDPPRQ